CDCHRDALFAVHRLDELVARGTEQIAKDASIILGVLDDQYPPTHVICLCSLTRTGMTTLKVEPTPMAESKSICPPCMLTSRREIERPSPVPPFLRVLLLSTCWNSSNTLD